MNEPGTGDPSDAAPQPPRRRDATWIPTAAVFGCVLVAVLAHGYSWELGAENQPLQIPVIERLKDPALFPGDPLVDALAQQRSVFFPAVAALSRWVQVEEQFFVLHLLTTAAAAAAMAAITGLLTGSRAAAFIAALLLLASPIIRPTPLGRDTMVATWVTPTTVSFPILLVALRFLLAGRAGAAGMVAGLAANLNLVMAGLFVIVALPVALGETRGMRCAARLGIGFVLAGLPALVALPEGSMLWGREPGFVTLLRRYYPYHFFLGVQSRAVFLRVAILVAAAVAAFQALPASGAKSRAVRMAIAVGVVIAAGSFFADVVPIAQVTQLHLLRADRWFCVLLFAAAAGGIARAVTGSGRVGSGRANSERPLARGLALAGGGLTLAGGITLAGGLTLAGGVALAAGLARGAYPLVAWGALVLLLLGSSEDRSRPWLLFLLVAAAGIAAERLWEPGYQASAALLVVLVMMALIAPWQGFAARRTRPWLLAAGMAIALTELSGSNGTLGAHGFALARPVFDPSWREVQEWAAHATPKAAKFLTPPEVPGFRVYARRGTVVEWKDGAAMLWEPAFGAGWWERQAAVSEAIASQNADQLCTTARRYGAGWIVVPVEKAPQTMTPVHDNPRFKVFAVSADGMAR